MINGQITAEDINALITVRSADNALESAGTGTAAMIRRQVAAVYAKYTAADLALIEASPEYQAHIATSGGRGGLLGAFTNVLPSRDQLVSAVKVAAVVGGGAYVLTTLAGAGTTAAVSASAPAAVSVPVAAAPVSASVASVVAPAAQSVATAAVSIAAPVAKSVATAAAVKAVAPPKAVAVPPAPVKVAAVAPVAKPVAQKQQEALLLAGGLALVAKFLIF